MNSANKYKIEIAYTKPIQKSGQQQLVMRSFVESDIELSDRELSAIARRWRDEYLPAAIEMTNGDAFVMEDEFSLEQVNAKEELAYV